MSATLQQPSLEHCRVHLLRARQCLTRGDQKGAIAELNSFSTEIPAILDWILSTRGQGVDFGLFFECMRMSAEIYLEMGDVVPAEKRVREILSFFPKGDPTRNASGIHGQHALTAPLLLHVLRRKGAPLDEAVSLLQEAFRSLDAQAKRSDLNEVAYAAVCTELMTLGDARTTIYYASRLYTCSQDPRGLNAHEGPTACFALSCAHDGLGELDVSLKYLDQGIADTDKLYRATGNPFYHGVLAQTLSQAALRIIRTHRSAEAEAYSLRSTRVAEKLAVTQGPFLAAAGDIWVDRAELLGYQGRLLEALAAIECAIQLFAVGVAEGKLGWLDSLFEGHLKRCKLTCHHPDRAKAQSAAREAVAVVQAHSQGVNAWPREARAKAVELVTFAESVLGGTSR